MSSNGNGREKTGVLPLTVAAIGVVFGDIGTSPLYAMREAFNGSHPVAANHDNVMGVLSLISWSLIIVVTLKYVVFMMRADNRGEGGIMALLALVLRSTTRNTRGRMILMWFGLFGAALFYGDGVITPAISVLSAVEGLEVATPALKPFVIPVTILVLIGLFLFQQKGTEMVGALFGPITLVWFAVLALLGIINIVKYPDVLAAFSPAYAVNFFAENSTGGFLVLGAVVLAITGTEALYADMGHFGKKPIRLAWSCYVLPALLLNYFGQGALILYNKDAIQNPFYHMAPEWALYPLVILATMATVIASQAVITGTYSLTRQAIQLGYCPRLEVTYLRKRDRPDLHALDQLGVAGCGDRTGARLRIVQQPRGRLWHRGNRHHGHRHGARLRADAQTVALAAVDCRAAAAGIPLHRPVVLQCERDQAVPRRLVPDRGGDRTVHAIGDLEARAAIVDGTAVAGCYPDGTLYPERDCSPADAGARYGGFPDGGGGGRAARAAAQSESQQGAARAHRAAHGQHDRYPACPR